MIAEHAAKTLKRVHLALGGKAPVVVFDDVDLETVLETVAGTGYYNAGQDCSTATRVVAAGKVYDDVVNGLAEQAEGFVMGDLRAPETNLGAAQLGAPARAGRGLLERASFSVQVVTGGSEPHLPGFYLEPTVVAELVRTTR